MYIIGEEDDQPEANDKIGQHEDFYFIMGLLGQAGKGFVHLYNSYLNDDESINWDAVPPDYVERTKELKDFFDSSSALCNLIQEKYETKFPEKP
jgi:hypothetical protein